MRYISPIQRFQAFRNNGNPACNPFYNGELVVGNPYWVGPTSGAAATQGYIIDMLEKTDAKDEIMRVYGTDFSGAASGALCDCAGLGSLTGFVTFGDNKGKDLGAVNSGFRKFYESPLLPLSSGAATTVSSYSGVFYEVWYGTAYYNGASYTHGEELETIGGSGDAVSVSGTGYISVTFPPALRKQYDMYYEEGSLQKYWDRGDEALDVYNIGQDGGFTPRASDVSGDPGFIGWTR